jgi:transcriptional regulator with XRE-family HTH domain
VDIPDNPVVERQRRLGETLAACRTAAGLNQTELARRLSYDRTTVAHAERGAQIPAVEFWQASDELLEAGGGLLRLYEEWQQAKDDRAAAAAAQARAERRARLERGLAPNVHRVTTVDDVPENEGAAQTLVAMPQHSVEVGDPTHRREVLKLGLATAASGPLNRVLREAAAETAEFTRRTQASAVGSAVLEHLDQVVTDLSDAYAREPPADLFQVARGYRYHVAQLIAGPKTLPETRELFTYAAWLSETLAWVTHDLGDPLTADAYCNDAWEHAAQAGHDELCAWAMDAKASIAMYAGHPERALTAALRGLRKAPAGHPLTVRLHGQAARACAGLARDGRGSVENCMEHLRQSAALYEALPTASPTRVGADTAVLATYAVHSYAASSYIWLERFPEAKTQAEAALQAYQGAAPEDRSPSREAIARIDLALALAALSEPDEACALGARALASERVVDSVLVRAGDLATAMTQRYPSLPATRELTDQVSTMRARQH